MKHLKFFIAALIIGLVMALLEIQIEGAHGWAANLPTWKLSVHLPLVGMWYGYKGKPLTGYHIYLWLFSFLLPHVAFLYTKWTFKKEFNLLSFWVLFTTFEGLLWFVFNPAWGWHKFREGIPWYKESWMFGLPTEYWIRFGAAAVLYWLADENTKIKAFKFPKFQK
jgi:CDP-diglyceride synthetase